MNFEEGTVKVGQWLVEDRDRLNSLLEQELELVERARLLRDDKAALEAEFLLPEMDKKNANRLISGSNEPMRKMQTLLALRELKLAEGPCNPYRDVCLELEGVEADLARARMRLKQAANAFSATKYHSRLVAAALKAGAE